MDGPSALSSSSAEASTSSSVIDPRNPLKGVVPGQVDYIQARALMVRRPRCLRFAHRPPPPVVPVVGLLVLLRVGGSASRVRSMVSGLRRSLKARPV